MITSIVGSDAKSCRIPIGKGLYGAKMAFEDRDRLVGFDFFRKNPKMYRCLDIVVDGVVVVVGRCNTVGCVTW